jgi:ATPase subunit of ABC transporter with duplicated ATPase domains
MISSENLTIQSSTEYLFHSISFKINPRDRVGVVGPSGCGKMPFLRTVAKH